MTAVAPFERTSDPPGTGTRRVLVVIDEACISPALGANVLARSGGEPLEAFVVAPAHGTAATQWYADEDAARAEATRRLRACVACLSARGIPARGELADPDPVQAIGDALRIFPADRILIVTVPQRPSTWPPRSLIERARSSFRQPIEHLVMPVP